MLRYALSFLAVVAITPLAEAVIADNKGTPPTIVWEKTLEDAVAKAKTGRMPIMLDFFVPT